MKSQVIDAHMLPCIVEFALQNGAVHYASARVARNGRVLLVNPEWTIGLVGPLENLRITGVQHDSPVNDPPHFLAYTKPKEIAVAVAMVFDHAYRAGRPLVFGERTTQWGPA